MSIKIATLPYKTRHDVAERYITDQIVSSITEFRKRLKYILLYVAYSHLSSAIWEFCSHWGGYRNVHIVFYCIYCIVRP